MGLKAKGGEPLTPKRPQNRSEAAPERPRNGPRPAPKWRLREEERGRLFGSFKEDFWGGLKGMNP